MARTEGSKNVSGTFIRYNCHWCGKEFYADGELWAYKTNLKIAAGKTCRRHIFCTWGCLRAAEKNAERLHDDLIAANRVKRQKKKAQEGG